MKENGSGVKYGLISQCTDDNHDQSNFRFIHGRTDTDITRDLAAKARSISFPIDDPATGEDH